MASRRLGQILVDLGYLTEDQLWDVLEQQKQSPGEVIGRVAVRMGLVNDSQVSEALAEPWFCSTTMGVAVSMGEPVT